MEVQEWLGEDNTLGIDIWNKKYRYNNESFDEWLDRVSGNDRHIRKLIEEKKFLFAGRILAGRGIDQEECKRSLSNCYVIEPPEDNLESIFDTGKELGRTYSYGGGCGTDISKLAPKGAKVRNAASESSGAVSFMDLYSLITGLISQNGRRGALMISLNVDHPDIEEFVTIKSDPNKVTKANISVKITDKFMEAVEKDEMFELYFKREETGEEIKREVNARALFALICTQAWDNAEPGVLFWDRITEYNLMQYDDNYQLAGTNPCGELPLPAGGSCLLSSINLAEFVNEDKTFNFDDFEVTVFEAIRAMNVVLDEGIPLHPLQVQSDSAESWRPIGLGIMGLADMLIKMGITYGSQESINLCDEIGKRMAMCAICQSVEEAETYGDFPRCDKYDIIRSKFFQDHAHPGDIGKVIERGIRNCQLLSIAPTGSLSTMLGISGGIEPIFDIYYERKTESLNGEDKHYKVYTQIVWDYMQEHGLKEGEEDKLPEYFVTAKSIDYRDRVKMQGIWQSHIDNSISSTVNLPNSATIEDVMDLYMSAWKEGCKGITIFREGCKRAPILSSDTKKEEKPMTIADCERYGSSVKEERERLMNLWMQGIVENHANKLKEMREKFCRDRDRRDQLERIKNAWDEYSNRVTENTISVREMLDSWKSKVKDTKPQSHLYDKHDITITEPNGTPIEKAYNLKWNNDIVPEAKEGNALERGEVIKAPANSIGKNRDLITGCGSLHFQAFFDMSTGDVVMTYLSKGSTGGCNSFMVGLSRMISMAGRAGINVYEIADQLHSAPACPSYVARKHDKKDTSKGTCCPVAVGYALIEMYEEVQEEIELGGVYKGSPLYYKLKKEKLAKDTIDNDLPKDCEPSFKSFIMPKGPKLTDAINNPLDYELNRITNELYEMDRKLYEKLIKEDLERQDREWNDEDEEPEIGPVPKEVMELAIKDLAEKQDGEIRDFLNDINEEKLKKDFLMYGNSKIFDIWFKGIRDDRTKILDIVWNEMKEDNKHTDSNNWIGYIKMALKPAFSMNVNDTVITKGPNDTGLCPECGNPLTFEGGCNTCKCCGWSKCD